MTVQGGARPIWLLRAVLVVGLGVLLTVLLTVLWSSGAWAQDDAVAAEVEPAQTVSGAAPEGTPADDVAPVSTVAATIEPPLPPVADELTPDGSASDAPMLEPVPEGAGEPVSVAAQDPAPPDPSTPPSLDRAPVASTTPTAPVAPPVADVRGETVVEIGAPSPAADLGPVRQPASAWPIAPRRDLARHAVPPVFAVPVAPNAVAIAHDPCPTIAPPVAVAVRPASSPAPEREHSPVPLPDEPAPVAAPPPTVVHARTGTARGDGSVPSGWRAACLPTWTSGVSASSRDRGGEDLPAGVEPPQLRVLSTRAGPVLTPVPATPIESLDSPA